MEKLQSVSAAAYIREPFSNGHTIMAWRSCRRRRFALVLFLFFFFFLVRTKHFVHEYFRRDYAVLRFVTGGPNKGLRIVAGFVKDMN